MTGEELYQEYLDLILGIIVVEGVEQAASHINKYGTHHSDAIITRSRKNARYFTSKVDPLRIRQCLNALLRRLHHGVRGARSA